MIHCKLRILFILFISAFSIAKVSAQITVGGDNDPAPYSIVEVVGSNGGVRLPRMTATEMTELVTSLASHQESEGLLVYNITNGRIEFWNGNQWIPLSSSYSGENGVSLVTNPDQALELGGTLNKQTEINQNGYDFDLLQGADSEFKAGILSAKNNEISILPSSTGHFKVNNNALSINGANGSIEITGEKVSINNNLLAMEGSTTSPGTLIKGTFQYKDGKESAGYMLVGDSNGNASWEGVRPFGTIENGTLSTTTAFNTSNATDVTTVPLYLLPGQWMILAKATILTTSPTAGKDAMYYWMDLVDNTGREYAKTGINPELLYSPSTTCYATPSLVHYVNINVATTFRIKIGSSNVRGQMTNEMGGSYFYAVRLDVPQ